MTRVRMDPQPPEDAFSADYKKPSGSWIFWRPWGNTLRQLLYTSPASMPQARPVFEGDEWWWIDDEGGGYHQTNSFTSTC